jgi:hypothetical protein
MNRYLLIAAVGLSLGVGFAVGWFERNHLERENIEVVGSPNNQTPDVDCDHASERDWHTVRGFSYQPGNTLYNAEWQYCPGEPIQQRVRITDANFQKVLFHYENDEVHRLEKLDLVANHVPQLLVLTMAGGTGDYIDWHVVGESNGALEEWKVPDYDGPAEKLLRSDENFGYKDWNFHMQGNEIALARGIYLKGEGNCCPGRGGVVVRLRPTQNEFELISAVRIDKPEYYRLRDQSFCLSCNLY